MKYIIGNWKMNMDSETALKWLEPFNHDSQNTIVIAPSLPHLALLQPFLENKNFELAAQDVSVNTKGAHTGETGAFQLKNFCKYCIIGHSERKEALEVVLLKRDLCLENSIVPIVCFTKPETAQKLYKKGAILAWEDPTNISKEGGYFEKASEEIESGIEEIRYLIQEDAQLVYGGSVNRQSIENLVNIVGLDGVLVGNASLEPDHFKEIIEAYDNEIC